MCSPWFIIPTEVISDALVSRKYIKSCEDW